LPVIAETTAGAPNMAAIPMATAIIKPQEILPVKKPIPIEMIAKAAKALPALPVTNPITLHNVSTIVLLLESALTVVPEAAKASEDKIGTIAGAIAKKKKDKRATLVKKEESFFIFDVVRLKVF